MPQEKHVYPDEERNFIPGLQVRETAWETARRNIEGINNGKVSIQIEKSGLQQFRYLSRIMIQSTLVMFADVSGSSELYKQLGDTEANRLISAKLSSMAQIILNCNGRIIKTIGDEIMAHFPKPVDGLNAAIGIQNVAPRTPLIRKVPLSLR